MIAEPIVASTLPDGWRFALLGSLAKVVGGGTPTTTTAANFAGEEGIPWITPADLGKHRGKLIARGARFLSAQGLKASSAQLLPARTVILSSRAPIGYLAVAENPVATNQGCKSFICGDELDPDYLFHYLRHARPLIDDLSSGTTFAEISAGNAAKIPIVFPSLEEQRRIAAKLDELLGCVATTRERLHRVPAILRRFRQSVLAAAVSGRLTADWRAIDAEREPMDTSIARCREDSGTVRTRRGVPETVGMPNEIYELPIPTTWSKVSIAELLRSGVLVDVKDGNHGANHPKQGDFVTTGTPFITAAQVKDYRIDYEGAPKLAGEPLDRIHVGFAQAGDAVLTHKGTVGRAAVNTEHCVLTPQTTYYRCNAQLLDAQYLVFMFTAPQFYNQVAAVMSQTTRDFVPISEQFRLFAILPPPEEQREIATRVRQLMNIVSAVEGRLASTTLRSEHLVASLLARAFRSELV